MDDCITLVPSHRSEWFHEYEAHLGAMKTLSATIASLERQHPGRIPSLRGQPTLLIGSCYSGFQTPSQEEPSAPSAMLVHLS
jgi:hypothetical protein